MTQTQNRRASNGANGSRGRSRGVGTKHDRDRIIIAPSDIRRVDRFARDKGPPSVAGPLADALARHYSVEHGDVQFRSSEPHQHPPALIAIVAAGAKRDVVHRIELPAIARSWYRERSEYRDAIRPLSFALAQCTIETALLIRHPRARGRVCRMDPFPFEDASGTPPDTARIERIRAALAHAWGIRDQPDSEVRRAVSEYAADDAAQAKRGYSADDLRLALDEFVGLTLPYQYGWSLRRSTLAAAKAEGAW